MILYTAHVLHHLNVPMYIWHRDDGVRTTCMHLPNVYFVKEKEPRGTGDALRTVHSQLPHDTSTLLTLHGDSSAFFRHETYQKLLDTHARANASLTLLTQKVAHISHTGRIIRDGRGVIVRNEELGDTVCNNCEINTGVCVFRKKWLDGVHSAVGHDLKGLRSIVDYIERAHNDGAPITDVELTDSEEKMHVNTQEELYNVQNIAMERIQKGLLHRPDKI